MAQSGYTPILIYASGTTGNTPSASNLTSSASGSELALNYFDGKLFYKDASGNVQVLASKAGNINVSSLSFGTTGLTPSTATTGAITVAGVLNAANGGTGEAGTLTGILYGNGTSAFTAASTAQVLSVIGTVPIANGGTNSTATPTAGGAAYGTGTAYAVTAAGTSGQALISAGAAAPAFGALAIGTANTNISGALTVTNGGTGLTTLTAGYIPYGNGTSAFSSSANMTFDGSTLTTLNSAYTGTLTGGTGIVNLGSGQFYKDASGNVGVGVTPSAWNGPIKAMQTLYSGTWNNSLTSVFYSNVYRGSGYTAYYISTAVAGEMGFNVNGAGEWTFSTAPSGTAGTACTLTERMRIDSSGNLLVGTTSLNGGTGGITNNLNTMTTRNTGATTGKFWKCPYVDTSNNCFIINNSNVGVYIADGATSWTANSDERFKDIIEPITDAANKVSTLRAVIGKYKTDKEGTRRSFLIAQDVQAVLPEAVTVGTDSMLGVQYTEVTPLLVAAIKEQQALITDLQARLTKAGL